MSQQLRRNLHLGRFLFFLGLWLGLLACTKDNGTDPVGPANEITSELYNQLKDSILAEFESQQYDSIFNDSVFLQVYNKFYAEEMGRLQSLNDSSVSKLYEAYQRSLDSLDSTRTYTLDSLDSARTYTLDSLDSARTDEEKKHQEEIIALQDSLDSVYQYNTQQYQQSINDARDSLYDTLYNEIYWDIYSQAATSNLMVSSYSSISILSPYLYPYLDSIYGSSSNVGQLATVSVYNQGTSGYHIQLEAEVNGITELAVQSAVVNPKKTTTIRIHPSLIVSAFADFPLVQERQVTLTLKVINNDREVEVWQMTKSIEVTPANVRGGFWSLSSGSKPDLSRYVAHWVRPQSDSMPSLIQSASAEHPDNRLVGYQDPSGTGNYAQITSTQVQAVYNALQKRGISYITAGYSGNVGQAILFPDQALRGRSANCMDGVVLFASVLERIGIEPVIVLIPGHAFLGWRTWSNSTTYDFLETTMAWGSSSFTAANSKGKTEYQDEVDAGNFTSGTSSYFSVFDARDDNIQAWPVSVNY